MFYDTIFRIHWFQRRYFGLCKKFKTNLRYEVALEFQMWDGDILERELNLMFPKFPACT